MATSEMRGTMASIPEISRQLSHPKRLVNKIPAHIIVAKNIPSSPLILGVAISPSKFQLKNIYPINKNDNL